MPAPLTRSRVISFPLVAFALISLVAALLSSCAIRSAPAPAETGNTAGDASASPATDTAIDASEVAVDVSLDEEELDLSVGDPKPADTALTNPALTDPAATPNQTIDGETATDPVPDAAPTIGLAPKPTPTPFVRPPAPNGRTAPVVTTNPAALAEQITTAERGLRDPESTPEQLADFGHLQQVSYRKLGRVDEWAEAVLELLPDDYRPNATKQLHARRSLRGLSSGFDAADFVPAWEIIEPEPAAALLTYYAEAQAITGIEWEYLAAINLIETGFGRINGLSSAGAQGPMQFIPTTWDEVGEGDVYDPHDAIIGAARYLVRRGGPEDMEGALWGYNNSDQYVAVVSTYADLLREDPSAFTGLYNWEIYFWTERGDVWLPVGLRNQEQVDLGDYLDDAPWSVPDPNLG